MVVEDDFAVRALVTAVLDRAGYLVFTAAGSSEALARAGEHQGPIHLLVTDVVMPRGNGRSLAEKLVLTRPDTRVLFMSGHTDDALELHGVVGSQLRYIRKPFTPQQLLRNARNVLDSNPLIQGHGGHRCSPSGVHLV